MSGVKGNDSLPPPPQPKSPPELCVRRKELAKVQVLEREIGFLEEELKSIEGLQLATPSCKEVMDFVKGNGDPLIPTTKKTRGSCHFLKWLCGGISCLQVSWICCCSLPSRPKMPSCCKCDTCHPCGNPCAGCCRMPVCCCGCWDGECCKKPKCSMNCCCCCVAKFPSCPSCSSSCTACCCTCYPKCLKLQNVCSCCQKSCCYPCYFCY